MALLIIAALRGVAKRWAAGKNPPHSLYNIGVGKCKVFYMTITQQQSRAARGLLDWSQTDLAKAAGLSWSTITDWERGKRKPYTRSLVAMRDALEAAGVVFTERGVELREGHR